MKFSFKIVLSLSFLLFFVACTNNKISKDQEIYYANKTASYISKNFGYIENIQTVKLLQRITHRLGNSIYISALESELPRCKAEEFRDYPWQVYIVNSNNRNAYSAGAGLIFITKGLLLELDSEAELASIISHEMAHNLLSHTQMLSAVEKIEIESNDLPFEESLELDADKLALKISKVSRYDLRHSLSALTKFYSCKYCNRQKKIEFSKKSNKLLNKRIGMLRQAISEMGFQYATTQNSREFNSTINSILY